MHYHIPSKFITIHKELWYLVLWMLTMLVRAPACHQKCNHCRQCIFQILKLGVSVES